MWKDILSSWLNRTNTLKWFILHKAKSAFSIKMPVKLLTFETLNIWKIHTTTRPQRGCRDGSEVKAFIVPSNDVSSMPSTHSAAHNHLSLQSQEIWYSLLASVGSWTYAVQIYPYTHKGSHIYWWIDSKEKLNKNKMQESLQFPSILQNSSD